MCDEFKREEIHFVDVSRVELSEFENEKDSF